MANYLSTTTIKFTLKVKSDDPIEKVAADLQQLIRSGISEAAASFNSRNENEQIIACNFVDSTTFPEIPLK